MQAVETKQLGKVVEDTLIASPFSIKINPVERASGYALPNTHIARAVTNYLGLEVEGFGEAQSFEVAQEKAKSELLERFILRQAKQLGIDAKSSNGWACHVTAEQAAGSAVLELLEREVACHIWQDAGPYHLIPMDLWPKPILEWNHNKPKYLEFSELKICLSSSDKGSAVTTLLLKESGNFVAGHASSLSLSDAIISATQECFRAVHMAIRFEYFAEVARLHQNHLLDQKPFEPGVHSLAYAYLEKMPSIIKFTNASTEEILTFWGHHQNKANRYISEASINYFKVAGRIVAFAKISEFSQMHWGRFSIKQNSKHNHPHIVG